jgi:Fe-S-cluster containining protein
MPITSILKEYGELLARVDAWFARAAAVAPDQIACCSGCDGCCRGLFDITLLDALYLRQGLDRLPEEKQRQVRAGTAEHLSRLQRFWPEFSAPYILNYRPEEEWEQLMPEDDETPCVLLGDEGRCLLYAWRPMTCRLNGIPLVDISGEIFFDEWCTLNYPDIDPLKLSEIRGEFRRIFEDELALFHKLTSQLFKERINELDTFIPTALLLDPSGFDWRNWLNRTALVLNPPL